LALKQSETLAINREKIREAEAHFTQALGTALPHVSFVRTETLQDTSESSSNKKRSFDQGFAFSQTLFSGFKEFAGMAGSREEVKQRTWEAKRAAQLLFVDVADAFYLLAEIQEDTKAMETTRQALKDRINDLKARVDIGKSRPSEISSTEVQLYTLEAETEAVKSSETVARDLLEFLIGEPVGSLTDDNAKFTLESESVYLRDVLNRPDVLATNYAWQADKKRAYIAKTGFLPSVSLGANSYTHKSSSPRVAWDALLSIDVPIFEGTETAGAVKAANAVARESELSYRRAIRLALVDIHDSYALASAAITRTTTLAKALQSAEQNYALQKEDYKLNLVNNLEVLSAIQDLENTRRGYNNAYYESRRLCWQLRAAGGDIPQVEEAEQKR
jgi:outer membrane protein